MQLACARKWGEFGFGIAETLERSEGKSVAFVRTAFHYVHRMTIFPLTLLVLRCRESMMNSRFAWFWRITVFSVADFVTSWINSRRWQHLLYGIPALLLALPLIVAAVLIPSSQSSQLANRYRSALQTALVDGDQAAAELYRRKIGQLGQETDRDIFMQAISLQESDMQQAFEKMSRLAPRTQPGIPESHEWIAQQALTGQLPLDVRESLDLAKDHVACLERIGWDRQRLTLLHGLIATCEGRLDDATTAFRDVANPTVHMELARLHVQQGNLTAATDLAETTLQRFQNADPNSLRLGPMEYLSLVSAHMMLGRDAELDHFVSTPFTVPEAFRADAALQQFFDEVVAQLLASGRFRRFLVPLSENCIRNLPQDNAWVWIRLLRIAMQNDAVYQLVRREIPTDSLQNAQQVSDPSALLVPMAELYFVRGEKQIAKQLFLLRLEQKPTDEMSLNNVAWLTMELQPNELALALDYVDRALQIRPGFHRFLHTRGFIYHRLQDWDKAVADLQLAVNAMPHDASIHAALSDAYRHLGDAERAAAHARLAKSVRAEP
ncbi:MAG: hypothetical protein R3C28_08515 [Pirellulaceae bacterium]